MTNSFFNIPTSMFVGFDEFDALGSLGESYPPHNVIKLSEDAYQIEIALAGFSKDEISVTFKDQKLVIEGQKEKDTREFFHRGISTKKFKKTFRLIKYIEPTDVKFVNGLLTIDLEKKIPEEEKPKVLQISDK